MEQHVALWNSCLDIIKDNVAAKDYETWFEPIVPLSFDNHNLTLCVPSPFFYEYIEDHFAIYIHKAIKHIVGEGIHLLYKVTVDNSNHEHGATTLPATAAKDTPQLQPALVTQNPVKHESFDPQLNPHYTFENYIEGVGNKLARSVGITIARNPGNTAFNPMFIYGESAVGKTHLANAIGVAIKNQFPQKRVLYIPAHDFQNQFIYATLNKMSQDFLYFYQTIDVLIIDDIQELAGKKSTLNTFFHIFNHLHQLGKQLIMCSDREPQELDGIEDRLISRFKWGLTAKIEKPDFALRKAILKHRIYTDGLTVPEDVIDYIAQNITNNIRDLEGVLISILAHSTLLNADINLQLAQHIIGNSAKPDTETATNALSIKRICDIVCHYYALPIEEINSKSRKQTVSEARQVAMYLARNHTNFPLQQIGQEIGRRDYSTVHHACKTIKNQMDVDTMFCQKIHDIEDLIHQ